MTEPDVFAKTPKKASRWFRAFIIFSLLYGITFSLDSFFNWIFFWAAVYSFFMSYFLLPVQPKIFQARPKQSRGPQFNMGGRPGQTDTTVTPASRARKVIIGVIAVMFGLFMIPFMIGVVEGLSDESTDTVLESEDQSSVEATDDSPGGLVNRGNDFFNEQQYDSANKYYDLALKADGSYGEAIYGKGIVAYQEGNKGAATAFFVRAYEGGFRYAWLSWVLADMYDKQGQTMRAANLYKESVSLDSTYTDSYNRLAELEPNNRQKYLDLAQKHASN